MDIFIISLILFFVVIGIATAIRYIIWKITDFPKNEYHYLIMLSDDDAEIALRGVLERSKFDSKNQNRKIYAVDLGLCEQTILACEKLSCEYPQIVYCKPNELAEFIKN